MRIRRAILLQQQLERDVFVRAQFFVEVREVRRAGAAPMAAGRFGKQGRFQPGLVPALFQRPGDICRFGPLQVLVHRADCDRETAPDLLVAQLQFMTEAQALLEFPHGQAPGRQVPSLSEGGLAIVMSSATCLWRSFRAIAKTIPGSCKTCSPSTRNDFRVHPGILFTFARNPHSAFEAVTRNSAQSHQ
jgi:hypothetical protein